ncbi:MAG: putative ABC transporter ATP-binding protein YheS [Candidatus Celerinatantimonas neptuna]|nr:MAG: putative ABC transporter ATP-binding protein YheS [Candidatus Celerinatantimonas neptuna]
MITLQQVTLQRGTKVLLDHASIVIHPGQSVGLVGQNGCGKSSLFSLLKGQLAVDSGQLEIPAQWQIASVAQHTPALECSALNYVIDGDREYRQITERLKQAEEQQDGMAIAHLHEKIDAIGGYQIESRAATLLAGLGFSQSEQKNSVASFSGGWRMRLNLAQALICRSDLLLLDEPTNHLDINTVVWLEQWLNHYTGTLVIISHDRDFLDQTVQKIIHIEQAQCNEYTGNYTSFEQQRATKLAQQQALHEKQMRQQGHLQKYIDRFRYKATKAKQAQSRIKALEKMELVGPAHVDSPFSFSFRPPHTLPMPLLQMDQVCAGYGDKMILSNIQFNLVPGSRIGLLGRNGAGKSTFIKLLSGDLDPLSGQLELNRNVQVGYFAQHQLETLHKDESPLAHLRRIAPQETEQELRNYLGCFGFQSEQALSPVAPFSGGEKARLVLALIVWQRPNLLLLDEPTNHLDLDMRHALTLALQEFEGAMVLVSHDRALLRASCDEFYRVDNGQISSFKGDLDEYQQWLKETQYQQNKQEETSLAPSRQQQKRDQAERRRKTKPLRTKIEKLEKQTEVFNQKLAHIEQQLSDPDLYQSEKKELLNELIYKQTQLKKQLEETEEQWLGYMEELENITE